jgi:hypothetical protein
MSSNGLSNGALTSSQSTSGVGWQVDIPNLVSILTAIGLVGLKKLQLSGIHLNTIGYLVKLGEITPCSFEFREQLHEARKNQRTNYWFHAVIEYGTGNNFVIDELLRTRSGENSLALLTSLVSSLDSMALEVLTILFQKMFPSHENAPGLDELRRVRSVCLPLVRQMDFKDRLAEIHAWLIAEFKPRILFNGREALPDSATIAELVKILFDITQDSGNRLLFYGVKGAAWLIVYCWKVLGLHVSVVRRNGHVHSIDGSYSSASVVVYPDAVQKIEIYHPVDKVLDIVRSSTRSPKLQELNWVLSCDEGGVDFFQICCGWDVKDRQEIGDLIYSIAREYIELRIIENSSTAVPVPYFWHHSETIISRLQQTLYWLGLRDQLKYNPNWRHDNFSGVVKDGEENCDLQLRSFPMMLNHVDEPKFCSHVVLQPREMKNVPPFCIRCRLYDIVKGFSYTSASLAFTDWCVEYKKISILRAWVGGGATSRNSSQCFQ